MVMRRKNETRREHIRRVTDFIFDLCFEAGAELKTCYMVAMLFATGLEQDMPTSAGGAE